MIFFFYKLAVFSSAHLLLPLSFQPLCTTCLQPWGSPPERTGCGHTSRTKPGPHCAVCWHSWMLQHFRLVDVNFIFFFAFRSLIEKDRGWRASYDVSYTIIIQPFSPFHYTEFLCISLFWCLNKYLHCILKFLFRMTFLIGHVIIESTINTRKQMQTHTTPRGGSFLHMSGGCWSKNTRM